MTRCDRRAFLATSAALSAGWSSTAGGAPAEPLGVALIGCGNQGRGDLRAFLRLPEVQVTALCDVDQAHLQDALGDLRRAGRPTDNVALERDFRRVLDRRDVDAAIIGTPDHWHAYILIAACGAGKDVYCEKPLSHNIVEGRAMVEAARRHRRVVQVGTQQRSGRHFQEAVRFVQEGRLGNVFLSRLLSVARGVRTRIAVPRLRRKDILAWVIAYHRRTQGWPTQDSGPIPEAPEETWSAVDTALRDGLRGLKGGSSLAQLLDQYGKKRNHMALPRRDDSGPVMDVPGETWAAVDAAVVCSRRSGACATVRPWRWTSNIINTGPSHETFQPRCSLTILAGTPRNW